MAYDNYERIIRQEYEGLISHFINYLRANFRISRDDAADIYAEAWIEARQYIKERKVDNQTKLKSLIFKIGWRQADKFCTRRPQIVSLSGCDDENEAFNRVKFEAEKAAAREAIMPIYQNTDAKIILNEELSYIPEPCNTVLNMYFDERSMRDIAQCMNYVNERTAISTKKRCIERLKERLSRSFRRLGLLDNEDRL